MINKFNQRALNVLAEITRSDSFVSILGINSSKITVERKNHLIVIDCNGKLIASVLEIP